MTHYDYIHVGPGPTLAVVTETVKRLTDSTPVGDWLHPSADADAAVLVKPSPAKDSAGGHLILIDRAADPVEARQELARRLYDDLVATTNWALELDSDDADDIIATRPSTSEISDG